MTISAKLSDIGGLEFVVSDPTDTDDVGGFSDAISSGAKTAKFSDTSIMQANTGLKIGMSQLKINSGDPNPVRTRTVNDGSSWTNPNNSIDGNFSSSSNIASPGFPLIIDFTSVDTQTLKIQMGSGSGGSQQCSVEISVESTPINFTFVSNISTASGSTLFDLGTQTWRFVRVIRLTAGGNPTTIMFEIFEELGPDTVTVRVRSSATQDTADGTVLITDQVLNPNQTLTFNTSLLLTGVGQFVTLEYVGFTGFAIAVNLSEITSVKEV